MNFRWFLLILIAVIYIPKVRSGNILSSQISYKSAGNDKYHVTIRFYRDCMADSSSGKDWEFRWFVNADTGYILQGVIPVNQLIRTSIQDVTRKCSTSKSPCVPLNSGNTGNGIEEHTLEYLLDLKVAPFNTLGLGSVNCEFGLAFSGGYRSGEFTTGMSNSKHWTRLMINFCSLNSCLKQVNSSPEYVGIPAQLYCCNDPVFTYAGGMDTVDYDSFGYNLIPAITAFSGTTVSYLSPFDYNFPLTSYCVPQTTIKCTPNILTFPPRGFYFNNGDFIFTPVKCEEVALVVVEITEWRKNKSGINVKVSTVTRELAFWIRDNCPYNLAPVITGPALNKICEGEKICFDVQVTDETFTPYQTFPDSVYVSWNHGIPGGTFTIKNPGSREKTAEFCWQTKVGQGSDVAYSFTVTATDQHCPQPAYTVRNFKVKVNRKTAAQRNYQCLDSDRIELKLRLPADFDYPVSMSWCIRDSMGNNQIFFSNQLSDTGQLYPNQRYLVICAVNNVNNCPVIYRDSVVCGTASVYPVKAVEWHLRNPVNSGDWLFIPGRISGDVYWFTLNGKLVSQMPNSPGEIQVPDLKPGVYILMFKNDKISIAEKIFVK